MKFCANFTRKKNWKSILTTSSIDNNVQQQQFRLIISYLYQSSGSTGHQTDLFFFIRPPRAQHPSSTTNQTPKLPNKTSIIISKYYSHLKELH